MIVTLYDPAPMLAAVVVTVSGATAVATADCAAVSTAASLAGAVVKVAVKSTVACSVLPVACSRWRLPGAGAGAAAPFSGVIVTMTADILLM